MFNLFKKKKSANIEIMEPLNGQLMGLKEIPDVAFQYMVQGIGIGPEDGEVVSPVDGKVVALFPTNHAIGITSMEGMELLIHIGVDTVEMNGEGFIAHAKTGDKVKKGQPLISFSLGLVIQKAVSHITAVVVTNPDKILTIECLAGQFAKRGETVIIKAQNK
jgi:PTS system glucose-specific IIA component